MSQAALFNPATAVTPYTTDDPSTKATLGAIDRSMRWPAIYFLVSAVLWLLAGTLFAIIASHKLTNPAFMMFEEWASFGRMRSAHLNAMAYGWANNVGFAVALWLMARLSRTAVKFVPIILTAAVTWNAAVTIGIWGILKGDMTSMEWLEMPPYITPLLAFSYALIGLWAMIAFKYRQTGHVYVSQWYILAALFWFPWLYSIAQIVIFFAPARGVVQAITNWWFAHNVLGLWLTPLGLASAYYFIPKVLGKPIHSYHLSLVGFWSLALFYNWAGTHHLIGGPIPAWVSTAGTVASVMMVIPVLVTALNHHLTVVGEASRVWASPTLRFTVFGAMSYTLTSFAGSAMAVPDVNVITHFTHFTVGHAHHGVYAFFTMVMFGAIYYMLPRLVHKEWPSSALIKVHFWCCGLGIGMMVTALSIGGWIQGWEMSQTTKPFLDIVNDTKVWLAARTISGVLIGIGHLAFAANFAWMLFGKPAPADGPTLLAEPRPTTAAR